MSNIPVPPIPTPPPPTHTHSVQHNNHSNSNSNSNSNTLPLSPASAAASVRRVHTISSSTSRSRSRIAEERDGWEQVEGVEEEYAYEGIGAGLGEEVWQENLGWEGDGLQRHNSMPSRYSRAFMSRYNQPSPTPSGQLRMKNSLQQIQAEAEEQGEEDWERDMRGLRSGQGASIDPALSPTDALVTPTSGHGHTHSHSRSHSQSSSSSPLSPFLPSLYPGPSLPKQGQFDDLTSDMRRAHSLTYGQHRVSERLARSPALRYQGDGPAPASSRRGHQQSASIGSNSSGGAVEAEKLSPPTSPVRASPWATPPPTASAQQGMDSAGVKDPSWEARLEQVQRTIAQFALDGAAHMTPNPATAGSSGTSTPAFSAPRFAQAAAGAAGTAPVGNRATTPASPPAGQPWSPQPQPRPALNLVTTPSSPPPPKGPTSSQAAFPPLGHGQHTNPYLPAQYAHTPLSLPGQQVNHNLGMSPNMGMGMPINPNMGMNMNMSGMGMGVGLGIPGQMSSLMGGMPAPPPLPAGYSGKHVQRPSTSSTESSTGTGASLAPPDQGAEHVNNRTPTQGDFDRLNAGGADLRLGGSGADLKRGQRIVRGFPSGQGYAHLQHNNQQQQQQHAQAQQQQQEMPSTPLQGVYVPQPSVGMTLGEALGAGVGVGEGLTSPIDVPALIAAKGYNPPSFETQPHFARYFVIKSYTEDDVHKSLKYEIWSSTEPGNKRLDRAFKESAGRGPIYLFFSVNASGHFCGVAEMLTPLDYTRSSTVWAQDKWKGVFKVRWIFVRDVPNSVLRHIKLNNTQEKKPVTNSRDTQELLPDAGQEMLRIFLSHPARTSLLQDFIYYEQQAQLRGAQGLPPAQGGPPQQQQQQQQQQQNFAQMQQQQQHQQAVFQPPILPFAQPGQRATPPPEMPFQQPFPSFAPHGMQPPQPPFAMSAHAQLTRTPSPQQQYEQTLQGILRRNQGHSPNPQQVGLGATGVQLPSGATGTPFVPSAVGMRGF